jgi:hypothetical protein
VTITTAGNCLLLIDTHRCAEMKVVSDIKRSEKDLPYLERTGRERGGDVSPPALQGSRDQRLH